MHQLAVRSQRLVLSFCAIAAIILVSVAASPEFRVTGHVSAGPRAHVWLDGPKDDAGESFARSPGGYAEIQRTFPAAVLPSNAYQSGLSQARHVRHLDVGPWQEIGPVDTPNAGPRNPKTHRRGRISGRVTALTVDTSTCSANGCGTIYVGSAGGGVWKSTDAGQTWQALIQDQPVLSIGTITLDPRNPHIIYVGTGDPTHGTGADRGIGILRSADGGVTWVTLGRDQFINRSVTSIVVDPLTAGTTNATIFAATTVARSGGSTTGDGTLTENPVLPRLGIYVSHDGGTSWQLVDIFRGSDYSVEALVLDPTDRRTMYAAIDARGMYKSTDAGATWTAVNRGLPGTDFLFVNLAIAPSSPSVLYAAYDIERRSDSHEEIYATTDGARNWSRLSSAPNACGSQCFADMPLTVDPRNAGTLYLGGSANYGYIFQERGSCKVLAPLAQKCTVALARTTDYGRTWSDIAENGSEGPLHPDDHVITIDPVNSSVVYNGSDGGLNVSRDGGATWEDLNRGLHTIQVQALSVDNAGDIYAGTQDNGTFMFSFAGGAWRHVEDGDGGNTAGDPQRSSVSYNSRYGANLLRNDHHGAPYKSVYVAAFHGDYDNKGRGNFYEPYAVAPSRSSDIFFGTYRVWRSEIRGGVDGNHSGTTFDSRKDRNDWVPISFDLSCSSAPSSSKSTCDSKENEGLGISAIAVSPHNPNVVVAASSNGHIWLSRNALAPVHTDASCDPRRHLDFSAHCNFVRGVTWTRIDNGLPHRFPSSISFYPGSSSTIFVSYSGFDETTPSTPGHIFATTDSGARWIRLTGTDPTRTLPNLPFSDVIVNPKNGHIYASADYGVYMSADNGATWARIDAGLPAAPVYQMQFYLTGGKLLVGTYGRGVWQITAP